jgi:cytochrome c-type biogenesis protein CcmF
VRSGILSSIHAFGASTLGVPFVLLIGAMVTASIVLVVRRRDALRSDAELDSLLSREAVFLFQNLVLVSMVFVIFWVTFFPLISEAITGTKVSVGPPAFRPFIVPLALILVLLSGIGPLIAWRRVTAANLRRNFLLPVLVAIGTLIALLAAGGIASRPFALVMFVLGAFVFTSVVQEFWRGVGARRAMTRDSPTVALAQLVRRNRRRYGGYIAHAGLAVLLVGVAASSSFQHSQDVILKPGQSVKVDGYKVAYVRPTASATAAKISFGAILNVTKGGSHVTTLDTSRGFYPSQDQSLGEIGRFFGGSADSDVGLRAGITKDIWAVANPDLTPLQGLINQGNRVFAAATQQAMTKIASLPLSQAKQQLAPLWALRDEAIRGLASQFVSHPWGVQFLIIVSPLVTWIWLGAMIIAAGGLIALWPVPVLARRRAASAYPSRPPAVPPTPATPAAPAVAARELA